MNILSIFEYMEYELNQENSTLFEFYQKIITDSEIAIEKIKRVHAYANESLNYLKEIESPSYTITEVYPKVKEGETKLKPYYRLQGSFTNNGKRERIVCHLAMMVEYNFDKNSPELKELAIEKMRTMMKAKSSLYVSKIEPESNTDNYLASAKVELNAIKNLSRANMFRKGRFI